MNQTNKRYHFETLQLHAGQEQADSATGSRAVPIYLTTSYVFEDCEQAENRFALKEGGNIYGRLTNPTVEALEQRMAALEGGTAALAVASGAAAVSYAIQNLVATGEHVVAARNIYGGTHNYLEHTLSQYGVSTTFVDPTNLKEVQEAIRENTKLVFVESMGNPNSEVVDIQELARVAHQYQIPLVVDNTFATPFLLQPIRYGADIVVHSASKFLGGHGTVLGGIIVEGGQFDWEASGKFPMLTEPCESYHGCIFTKAAPLAPYVTRIRAILLRDTGATLSPVHAFAILQGLESLSLRVERHVTNALEIVRRLQKHPLVETVFHPSVSEDESLRGLYQKYYPQGGGSIFTITIRGGEKKARQFIHHLQLFSLLANVADAKSLVIHPASTTHAQLSVQEQKEAGIFPNTVRLSIGTEHVEDLWEDLEQALQAIE